MSDTEYKAFLSSLKLDQKVGVEAEGQIHVGEIIGRGIGNHLVLMPGGGIRRFLCAGMRDEGQEWRCMDTKRIRRRNRHFMPYDGIARRLVPLKEVTK